LADVEIRDVADEPGTQLSLDIWNTVYGTMPASRAGQQDYVEYCTDTFDVLALLR
jgi:hypothetical protein